MSEETEIGTQILGSSFSETMELKFRQEPEMETPATETSSYELILRSVDQRIKQATDPFLRRIKDLYALLAGRTEMESAENSEASGSKRNREFVSPSRNRYDLLIIELGDLENCFFWPLRAETILINFTMKIMTPIPEKSLGN